MRALVLCDDHYHPAHVAREGLGPLEAGKEFTFDWIEDAGQWSAEGMDGYPVVVLAKSNAVSAADRTEWMTPEVERAFLDYVRGGHGLLVVHSGSAEYQDTPVLRALIGGVFDHHPPQCPVTVQPVEVHPLTAGSAPFTAKDEHYFMAMGDEEVEVFMTTTSEHGTQPGGWTRTEGAGRVCVLTPGHNVEVWLHPSFQALLRNALRWCGGQGG
jgi:type 1 glutamine amidotransferase